MANGHVSLPARLRSPLAEAFEEGCHDRFRSERDQTQRPETNPICFSPRLHCSEFRWTTCSQTLRKAQAGELYSGEGTLFKFPLWKLFVVLFGETKGRPPNTEQGHHWRVLPFLRRACAWSHRRIGAYAHIALSHSDRPPPRFQKLFFF